LSRSLRISSQRRRWPVFHKIGQLAGESYAPLFAPGGLAADGETFLELIEDQKRCDEVVAGTPEVIAFPMEVLPKCFPGKRHRSLDVGLIGGFGDGGEYLLGGRSRAVRIIQTDRDWEIVFGPQGWEETGLKERSLAETRYAIEQRKRVASDKPEQFVNLLATSGEEFAVTFSERRQPNPRVFQVGELWCAHWEAARKRRSRTLYVSVLMNSGCGSPPPAPSQLHTRK